MQYVFFVLVFFRSATLSDGDPLVIFFGLKRVSERALQDTVTILGAQSRLRAARQHIPLLIEPCISQKWARPSKRPCSVCVCVFRGKERKKCSPHGQTKQRPLISTFIHLRSVCGPVQPLHRLTVTCGPCAMTFLPSNQMRLWSADDTARGHPSRCQLRRGNPPPGAD